MKVPIYSGCGNTFAVIDNRHAPLLPEEEGVVRALAAAAAVDGVIFLAHKMKERALGSEEIPAASCFAMRIFNRDGTEASFCGNGLRVLFPYLLSLGYKSSCYEIWAGGTPYLLSGESLPWHPTVAMPLPIVSSKRKEFSIGEELSAIFSLVEAGVPHATAAIPSLRGLPPTFEQAAAAIRSSSHWGSAGANVTLCWKKSEGNWGYATYERGVEVITAACGSGAAAAFSLLYRSQLLSESSEGTTHIVLTPPSGEELTLTLQRGGKTLEVSGAVALKGALEYTSSERV